MATFLSGENAKVSINEIVYAVKRFSIKIHRPRRDVSNTEGKAGNPDIGTFWPGYESARPGLRKATVTLDEPSFDLDDNVFSGALALAKDDYVDIKIWPNGRADDYHWFPSIQLEEVGHDGTVGEEQPVNLQGSTDSRFILFGEPK